MIDRRSFMNALPVVAGALYAGPALTPRPEPKTLAVIHKLSGGEWVRVRMFELRAGDMFHHGGFPEVFKAAGMPFFKDDCGEWAIEGVKIEA